ncbi:hypothetical protein [Lacticaseibacillus parakribbianus]|uniref:hypothetical protein n=1 Tax=Lacticaseibacillus parakribbianus TaxID=2970927 RepID=UPI0021CB3F6B|nr:hypothetical protein [Lacticaseibacillus parakribbianus]
MKRVIVLALSIILIAGCSAHRASNAEKLQQASRSSESKLVHKRSSAKKETKAVSYHQLSKVDRDKVFFRFKATQDSSEATSGTNGQGDSPCFVDMEITNKTEKKVTLDTSKILLYESQQDPEKPAVSKILTIAPGKSKMVERIFDNMNPQYFVGGGTFIYLSNEFPLAYTYMAFKGNGSTSDSLKNKEAIEHNREAEEVASGDEADDESGSQKSAKYTSQQLALLAQIFGQQDRSDVVVKDTLSSLRDSTITYSADTNTTGNSSVGTPLSYEEYRVSGDTLMIMHPAGQGSDAWSGDVNLNEALHAVFVQNGALAHLVLSSMQAE